MSSLVIEDLRVTYGRVPAVRGISFSCRAGEVLALVGPNGAGKSSTLLGISGALRRAAVGGSVLLDGRELRGRAPETISRAGVLLVPERRRIFPSLTVHENLLVASAAAGGRRLTDESLAAILERFPALGSARDRAGGLLSGGQQQQLAIARALVARPRFLLLDEPSLGLSPDLVRDVFEILADLRSEEMGIVLVEQQVVQAIKLADRSFVIRKGVIADRVDDHRSERLVSAYLGEMSIEEVLS